MINLLTAQANYSLVCGIMIGAMGMVGIYTVLSIWAGVG